MLRVDLKYIYQWIPAHSRILDLGCGEGELLYALTREKNCHGYGVERNDDRVLMSLARGVNIIQGEIEETLCYFANNQFDVIILSQTIQAMQNTEHILCEMARVAKQFIVSFPNFAYWPNRAQISFLGKMPESETMPYHWYNTPNIHWCTLRDFEGLCQNNGLKIMDRVILTRGKRITWLANYRGSLAAYLLKR